MNIKLWAKTKLRNFLDVDKLETVVTNNKAYTERELDSLQRLHFTLKQKTNHNTDAIQVIHTTLENIVHVGSDIYENERGHSWAVVCIEGKVNVVKFVELDRHCGMEILKFMKQFEAGRHCSDTPRKEMFIDGLFKF